MTYFVVYCLEYEGYAVSPDTFTTLADAQVKLDSYAQMEDFVDGYIIEGNRL